MQHFVKNLCFAVLAGLFFAYTCAWTIGYAAAITMPQWYLEFGKASSVRAVWFFAWDFVVVQMVGAGILCFVLIYSFIRLFNLHRTLFSTLFVVAYCVFIYVVDVHSMRLLGTTFDFTLSWIMHPLAIVISVMGAAILAKHNIAHQYKK